ncbi:hypothetical protein [Pandoraea pnomenusa]|uniref:hypothetical protein n=1 Tax=Pandoraea pnomenusa TaxID=93220 RepID=UPI001146A445|nr:hypothetical protein [Pandoraea pnomenusa]QDH59463.1 hypothetical protein FKQ53_09330 [Pandoraea pnomenusa]
MKDLQEATEKICELKGELFAIQALMDALLRVFPREAIPLIASEFEQAAELARVILINHAKVGESVISSFDLHTENMASNLEQIQSRG